MNRSSVPDSSGSRTISRLSVVVPAFNEEENIKFVLDRCKEVLPSVCEDYEVVVVDDASSDRTREIVEGIAQGDSRIRLLCHRKNAGAHAALRTGIEASRGDAALFIPADRQVLPDIAGPCVAAADSAEIVCTHRVSRKDPLSRRAMAWLYNVGIRTCLGLRIHDVDSCFLINRSVIDTVLPEVGSTSAFIVAEILARGVRHGFGLAEIQIDHFPREFGKANGVSIRNIARVPADFVALLRKLRSTRRAVRVDSAPRDDAKSFPPGS